jgi:hypothetical protein
MEGEKYFSLCELENEITIDTTRGGDWRDKESPLSPLSLLGPVGLKKNFTFPSLSQGDLKAVCLEKM